MKLDDLTDAELKEKVALALNLSTTDIRENQILYYKPASERARAVHFSRKKWVGISGGNRSSKTETTVAHISMQATGMWPSADRDPELNAEMHAQFRGPINVRIVVESFTTTLYPTILPKFRYSTWVGADQQGGERGHWGWVPKICLINGDWDQSWKEKTKTLTIICYDPDTGDELGHSIIQFMSKDQDSTDFASGSFHIVMHDEPPLYAQWRENQARVMDVGGRIFLAFTWPDDPTVPVDWVYDELYDKAGDEQHDWFELWTTDNVMLNQESVALQANEWSEETKRIRLYGGSMRFSNRVHPLFTDIKQIWCMNCKQPAFIIESDKCTKCGDDNLVNYCHVDDFEQGHWPCVFLLDPHPRKPHMMLWAEITPSDDIQILCELEVDDTPEALAAAVFDLEEEMGLHVPLRLIDPNMGRSPSSSNRETTWQDEFDKSGLLTELAENTAVGRKKVDEYLKVDEYTLGPRLVIHERCHNTIYQMKRYVWADFKSAQEKDVKQTPREKYDDYPTLLKYLVNQNVLFSYLNDGAPILTREGTRRGAY